jgi:hypothetical protein
MVENLDAEAKLAVLWLHTAHVTPCGWGSATLKRFIFETDCKPEALQRAYQALGDSIIVLQDGYWLRDFIRQQINDGERLLKNNWSKALFSELPKLPQLVRDAILSEYPVLAEGLSKGLPSPAIAQEKRREEKNREEQSRGSAEGGQNSKSNPAPPDRASEAAKKEGAALDVDPPDLAEYLAAIGKYNAGNSDGLVIPEQFVRHWHNLRLTTDWHKANSDTPIPNTFSARLADLKVLARSYQTQGNLAAFATQQTASKKEKARSEQMPCPTAEWLNFARETIGWSMPADSALRWEDLTTAQQKEFMRNWDCQQRCDTNKAA